MTIAHFYCAALSFLFGVFFTSFISLTLPFLTLCLLLAGVLIYLVHFVPSRSETISFFWPALALLFFALGGMRVEQTLYSLEQTSVHTLVNQVVVIDGVVKQEPVVSETTKTLYVKSDDATILVRTDVHVPVAYGDRVQVSGTLSRPEDFETDFGRVFAYTNYLAARGVLYQIEFAKVEVTESGLGNYFITRLLNFKARFLEVVYQFLPEPASGLASGLVLGVNGSLGEDLETAFRQSGIIHIVVLSGYNVMLVVVFVMFLLKQFLSNRLRLWFGLLAVAGFALLVGLSATVVRASIMAALLLVMEVMGRTYIILRGLLLAAVCMLLFNPLLLAFDIGFQLSFLATLGLILLAPYVESRLGSVPNPYSVRDFFIATVATQIAVLPLLLYQIGEVSLVSLLVNLLVLPIVPFAMLLVLLLGISGLIFPAVATVVAYGTYAILMYIIGIASWFSSLPYAAISVPPFPWWVMMGVYGVGIYLYWRHRSKDKNTTVDMSDVAGWMIVEESDLDLAPKVITKETEPNKDSISSLPIFFR